MKPTLRFLTTLTIVILGLAIVAAAADKIKIEKLDDLPRHTYQVDVTAVAFLSDEAALMKLAGELKRDMLADLEAYEIDDKTTMKGYYSGLGRIALVEGEYDLYKEYLTKIKALEDKEALQLTAGMISLSIVAAQQAPEDSRMDVFNKDLVARLAKLPYGIVEPEVKSTKGRYEMISENLMVGMMDSRIQPVLDQTNGEVSKDIAMSLVGSAAIIKLNLPYQTAIVEVVGAYIDANATEKVDIWADREVMLEKSAPGKPVIVTIWDSGCDTDVYADLLWTNGKEIPANGKDDDNNGFVDDVHGIAYTLHSDKTTEMLYPIGDVAAERPRLQKQMKGLTDIGSGVDSPEATDLKKELASLQPQEAQPFIEDISKYGNHCHGTHVAGIALRGNPFAQLMVSRLTFGYKLIPEEPTVEQAVKDSAATIEICQYYRDNGVRVVNMSWGGDLSSVEAALEANNAGGTPEERKALSRKIFEIGKNALYDAMKNTPGVLYITSAGNSDNDVTFEEVIPSGFDLPNMMTVGAVDQAGDETGFTSFGKVDCYANGYEVLSNVPGGDNMKLSGTSQSSPQVTNLASKLLALRPDLTPVQVRDLIVKGCDEKQVGDRTVRLMNPKNTMKLLKSM